MAQNPQEVTNPGLVDVAYEGEGVGPLSVDQAVLVGPSSNPSAATPAAASGGLGGGTATTTNPGLVNVANQSSGGLPTNTFVP